MERLRTTYDSTERRKRVMTHDETPRAGANGGSVWERETAQAALIAARESGDVSAEALAYTRYLDGAINSSIGMAGQVVERVAVSLRDDIARLALRQEATIALFDQYHLRLENIEGRFDHLDERERHHDEEDTKRSGRIEDALRRIESGMTGLSQRIDRLETHNTERDRLGDARWQESVEDRQAIRERLDMKRRELDELTRRVVALEAQRGDGE